MTHTIRDKKNLLLRIRRIRGQIEALERAVEGEAGCGPVMHLIAGVRGSAASLMAEVLEDHVRSHFVDRDDPAGNAATREFVDVMRVYLK